MASTAVSRGKGTCGEGQNLKGKKYQVGVCVERGSAIKAATIDLVV